MLKKIFSGVQPSGNLHLGNFLGAIKNFVSLQNQENTDCVYCIVDLHAITTKQDPKALKENIRETLATFIASGIDPKKALYLISLAVSAHSEGAWILSCIARMGWLNRMTQFKEKAGKDKEKASVGLYSYPILMASDILLYDSTHVPVGDDQKQHLELCRDIAQKFNLDFNVPDFLKVPEPIIQKYFSRIMSLKDGTKKMSKSDPSDLSRVNLTDDKDVIKNKIKKAKTDSLPISEKDIEKRFEAKNLLEIYSSLSEKKIEDTINQFDGRNFSEFKEKLSDIMVEKISPISLEINKLLNDKKYLDKILIEGIEKADKIANKKILEMKKLLDFKMFVQTQTTPNPNSLKFIPGKAVSNKGPIEITDKKNINNELVKNILSINGVTGIFLGEDFLSVNKKSEIEWQDLKHIIISYINEFYSSGNELVIDDKSEKNVSEFKEIEKKIIKILETKIRPAVARDGGDIKFNKFENGIVEVKLQGSCSGCPSSVITLKNGVQNLLTHYIPEVKEVIAI